MTRLLLSAISALAGTRPGIKPPPPGIVELTGLLTDGDMVELEDGALRLGQARSSRGHGQRGKQVLVSRGWGDGGKTWIECRPRTGVFQPPHHRRNGIFRRREVHIIQRWAQRQRAVPAKNSPRVIICKLLFPSSHARRRLRNPLWGYAVDPVDTGSAGRTPSRSTFNSWP